RDAPNVISAPLNFGSAEGILFGFGTISGSISGSGGIIIDGRVNLSGVNNYTGQTSVSGTVQISSDVPASGPGPLGADQSAVVLVSNADGKGALSFVGGSGQLFARPL